MNYQTKSFENTNSVTLNDAFRPYYIKVRAVNQIGKAMSNPLTVSGHSGEARKFKFSS